MPVGIGMTERMQKQNPSVRKLLMLPLTVGMGLLLFLIGSSLYGQYAFFQEREVDLHREAVLKLYEQGVSEQKTSLGMLLEVLSGNPAISGALVRRDADALAVLYRNTFAILRARFGVTHLMFLDPQRRVIVRLDQPDAPTGEVVTRFTLLEAERTGKTIAGLDLSAEGELTMRVASPVFTGGKCIGYIESGMEISPLVNAVSETQKVSLIFFLNKSLVSRDVWERGVHDHRPAPGWESGFEKVEVHSSLPEHDEGLSRRLLEMDPSFQSNPDARAGFSLDGRYYMASYIPLRDSLGTPMGSLYVLKDTTELRSDHIRTLAGIFFVGLLIVLAVHKISSSKLQQTDTLIATMISRIHEGEVVFQNVFEESETGFVLQNRTTGEVVQANHVALGIFGSADAAGVTLANLQPLPPEHELQENWHETGSSTPLMSILTGQGTRYCEISRFVIGPGKDIECVAIRDVTRVVTLQQEKRMQFEQLQTIIDQLPGMVFIKDSDLRLVLYNASFARIFGSGSSMLGEVRFAEWMGNDMDRLLETDRIALELEEPCTFEDTVMLLDGQERTYVTSKQVLREKDGSRLLLSVSTDITERSRVEKQLISLRRKAEEASHAKSQFLASMSHEIRTPMNAILGMSHLAIKADPEPRQRNYLTKISDAARHLLGIINDILDFSKVEAGEMSLESIPFSLREIVDDIRNITQPMVIDKPVKLEFNLPDIPDQLVGDPLRLRQVLLNLINNAAKFTAEGAVRLFCSIKEDRGDHYIISFAVEDTGIGIPEDGVQRLFTSFHQVDGSTTRKYGGTGLGLAISRRLVSLMGGSISVQSTPGRGSTFFFSLPLGKATQLPAESESATGNKASASGNPHPETAPKAKDDAPPPGFNRNAHVLVVEDNEINKEIIVELLRGFGLSVSAVENGREAVDAVRVQDFSLVLMDLQMPEMDGIEATRSIRLLPDGGSLPIVALTANAMAENRDQCLASGMNDFLSKPINVDELEEKLLYWLNLSQ